MLTLIQQAAQAALRGEEAKRVEVEERLGGEVAESRSRIETLNEEATRLRQKVSWCPG